MNRKLVALLVLVGMVGYKVGLKEMEKRNLKTVVTAQTKKNSKLEKENAKLKKSQEKKA